jgi:hypothetical protein
MVTVINPKYLEVFLEFRSQYYSEIYESPTLNYLLILLSESGEGVTLLNICRPEEKGDYFGVEHTLDKIDVEIVDTAQRECIRTGNPLVLPESLRWRYEFTLFFVILFTRFRILENIALADNYNPYTTYNSYLPTLIHGLLIDFAAIPDLHHNSHHWDSLNASVGWNQFMLAQTLDSVSDGKWDGFSGNDWKWGTFLIHSAMQSEQAQMSNYCEQIVQVSHLTKNLTLNFPEGLS